MDQRSAVRRELRFTPKRHILLALVASCSYYLPVRYAWHDAKRQTNIAKHGVDFTAVEAFEWDRGLVRADIRVDYSEPRLVAMAPIGQRLHVLVYSVERRTVRVISLRKANSEEVARYEQEADSPDA
jgi:hypothetical protein